MVKAEASDAEKPDAKVLETETNHAAEEPAKEDDTLIPTSTPTPLPTQAEAPVEIPIDFKALKEQNEDIYAWITVEGTAVDYPVLQSSEDDGFYLHRGIDKEELFAGAIYSEKKNRKDFSNFHTVLYGHNMKDGSMFASLHNFRDEEFFRKHREILVYTPEHIYHYEIFAAYTFDDRHLLNSYDLKTKAGRNAYLEDLYNVRSMDAHFLEGRKKVTRRDKLLTLSTCIGQENSRYLVQGVLTETE